MSRRLEIELTSERPDGTWTWRAAGARQPKGEMDGGLLPTGSKVGDVVRADAEFMVDGIEITAVLPPKAARKQPELLEIKGSGREEPLVTTQLAKRGRDDRGGGRRNSRDRGERGDRRDRGERGDRGDRGPRRERSDRPRGPRPDPVPERPKPKRLRPGRANRNAVLDELPVEQRPIAEQVLRGGVPAVREAIAKQNEEARAKNQPEVPADQLVAMAEQLLPRLRAAEWKDRAEAAIRDLDELDLRDLRSVVVAADGVARDDESKALVEQLQSGLTRRVEQEHQLWISDITANLDAGRFVRALRLSSRPPKAGTPVPTELSARLVAAVSEGLTPGTNQELWAAAVDALAYSPVRNQVTPAGRPEQPTDDLLEAVRRVADRVPKVAELFGVDPSEAAAAKKRRPPRGRGAKPGAKPAGRDGGRPPKGQATSPEKAEPGAKAAPAEQKDAAPAEERAAAPAEETAAPAEGPAPAPAEETAAAPVEDQAPAPAEESAAAPVEDPAPAPAEETAAAPVEDQAPAPAEETAAPVEDPTPAPAEETAAAPVEETAAPAEDPAPAPAEESAAAPAEDAAPGADGDEPAPAEG